MCNLEVRVCLSLAAAFVLMGGSARAETAIQVSIDCQVPGMKSRYGADLPNLLDRLRFQLVQELQGLPEQPPSWPDLVYWRFAQGFLPALPTQHKEAGAPQLRFTIFQAKTRAIKVGMKYWSPPDTDSSDSGSWETEWMPPGRVPAYGYPDKNEVVANLLETINGQLIGPNSEPLRRLLVKSAALSEGGIWDSGTVDLRVVLPLPWERYGPLSQSEFRLACTWNTKPDPPGDQAVGIELLSCGTGSRGSYSGSPHPYPAIAVAPFAWRPSRWEKKQSLESIRARARQLRPLLTYLDEDPSSLCSSKGMEVIQ
ncbi:MAG TPA: hypothetical protein VGH73_04785 [Thermoanaerobaculia bacterium]|jgi:hypothetical protein